jgi:ADP-dependent NAD(P)H-hydrate dehydratase
MSDRDPGRDGPDGTDIRQELLRAWPLPVPSSEGDKEERGRVLIVGGCAEMPGAVILAAEAALRAGAGKLTVACGASAAAQVALAIPESRVIALPETATGTVGSAAAHALDSLTGKIDAVLVGPGMQEESALAGFVCELLEQMPEVPVLLDACAMGIVRRPRPTEALTGRFLGRFSTRVLLTPHAGEMAHLSGASKEQIAADPRGAALEAAARWQAVVALKGATTFVAAPDGRLWRHEGGNIGLAVSGSGDTLAGIIAGLAARGADLEQAAVWGVALHAGAGQRLAAIHGPLGFLARELGPHIPALMRDLSSG